MKLFSTISSKFIVIIVLSITITVFVGFFTLSSILEKSVAKGFREEMRAVLLQAESTTDHMSNLGQSGAFDFEHKLKEDLERVGVANYRQSLLYKTVPVVSAWDSVRKAIKDTKIQFRIVRDNARNSENTPKNDYERQILSKLETSRDEEFFEVNRKNGVIAYARPVILSQSCMSCHGDPSMSPTGDGKDILGFRMEGWKPGERRGIYLLTAPISEIDEPTRQGFFTALLWTTPVAVGILFVALSFVGRINKDLNKTIHSLGESSTQLTDASVQISEASATLAEGASEQAASLEETSASLEEISSMTKRNAENAQNARELSRSAREAAELGASNVQEMSQAMADIQAASANISKIIKTIDEIAFQTNILALNAAVEAARAGEAGMGFAVVADEVRALAQRSAQAARETAERIEDSIRKSINGVTISEKVSKNLEDIVQRIRNVDELVAEIAAASREQSQGIEQVNTAVNQMDKVIQKNAAHSQEFAAAASQLQQQSAMLKEAISGLRKMTSGQG